MPHPSQLYDLRHVPLVGNASLLSCSHIFLHASALTVLPVSSTRVLVHIVPQEASVPTNKYNMRVVSFIWTCILVVTANLTTAVRPPRNRGTRGRVHVTVGEGSTGGSNDVPAINTSGPAPGGRENDQVGEGSTGGSNDVPAINTSGPARDGREGGTEHDMCSLCMEALLPETQTLTRLACGSASHHPTHDFHRDCFEDVARNSRRSSGGRVVVSCPLCRNHARIDCVEGFENVSSRPVPRSMRVLEDVAGVAYPEGEPIDQYFCRVTNDAVDPIRSLHRDILRRQWPPYRPPPGWSEMVSWCRRSRESENNIHTIPNRTVGQAIVWWARTARRFRGGNHFPAFPWPIGHDIFYNDSPDDVADREWQHPFENEVVDIEDTVLPPRLPAPSPAPATSSNERSSPPREAVVVVQHNTSTGVLPAPSPSPAASSNEQASSPHGPVVLQQDQSSASVLSRGAQAVNTTPFVSPARDLPIAGLRRARHTISFAVAQRRRALTRQHLELISNVTRERAADMLLLRRDADAMVQQSRQGSTLERRARRIASVRQFRIRFCASARRRRRALDAVQADRISQDASAATFDRVRHYLADDSRGNLRSDEDPDSSQDPGSSSSRPADIDPRVSSISEVHDGQHGGVSQDPVIDATRTAGSDVRRPPGVQEEPGAETSNITSEVRDGQHGGVSQDPVIDEARTADGDVRPPPGVEEDTRWGTSDNSNAHKGSTGDNSRHQEREGGGGGHHAAAALLPLCSSLLGVHGRGDDDNADGHGDEDTEDANGCRPQLEDRHHRSIRRQRHQCRGPPAPVPWEQYVRTNAPLSVTFSWLFSPLLLDVIGDEHSRDFICPPWWLNWVNVYRESLEPLIPGVHAVDHPQGGRYIRRVDQERLLEERLVSASRLNDYAGEARALALNARANNIQPATALPGLSEISPTPATDVDEWERRAELHYDMQLENHFG